VLLDLPLSRCELDRAAHLRGDLAALAEMWQRAKIIELIDDQFRIKDESLDYVSPETEGDRFFLGLDKAGAPYFVAYRKGFVESTSDEFQSLRTIGKKLADLEIGAAVHALALAQWHESHQRCAKCGGATVIGMAGAIRKCSACSAEHHPRTDPAVIVLVKDESDRILLGRQKVWPEKRFSTFAGFVEPGESFESTVLREVAEECGGQVISMKYLGSQPWPFPASIMIAYEAVISNPGTTKADGEEIEEIIWLDRELLKAKVASQELLLPPAISVARAMINSWCGPSARELVAKESWRDVGR